MLMSVAEITRPTLRRPTVRIALPLFLLVVTVAAPFVLWNVPIESWELGQRTLTIVVVSGIGVILLGLWYLFLSGLPIWLRVLPVAFVLLGGGIFAAFGIRSMHPNGDMIPQVVFTWEKSADELLEEHRRNQATSAPGVEQKKIYLDFRGYFGTYRDGHANSHYLTTDWKTNPPEKLWRQPCGGGYSGFALHDDAAYTLEQRKDKEVIVCYDALSGRERWTHGYNGEFREALGGPGPRATPTIGGFDFKQGNDGPEPSTYRIFSLGATGTLVCLDLDGKEQWTANILKDNDNLMWGMAGSPLVVGEELYVTPGVQKDSAKGRGVIVYEAKTGKELRAFGNRRGAYSSPVIETLCGMAQLLVFDADGLTSYDPKSGKEFWNHPWVSHAPQFINVAQPLVFRDDRVFISSAYDMGCAMLKVHKDDKPEVLWQNKNLRCKFTSPVTRNDSKSIPSTIFGLDDGILVCLDATTGERKWKDGRYGHGQILCAGGHILVLSEKGELILVHAASEGFHEEGRFLALKGKTWNPPAMSREYVFVRNDTEMAAYRLPWIVGEIKPAVNSFPSD
jgi:outer membrane protein assembly factor BamB